MTLRVLTLCRPAAFVAGLCAVCAGASGCSQSEIAGDAGAGDAPDRIPALVRLARGEDRTATRGEGDAKGLSVLVHSLDDDDPAVRLFAVQALRERTGLAFGYRYYDSAEHRRPAVRRWRDWLDQQDAPGSPDPGTPDPGSPPPASPNTASAP